MTDSRSLPPVVLTFAIALGGLSVGAQRAAVTLALEDGTHATPIARLADGRWVSAGSCLPGDAKADASAAPERLTVTGAMTVQAVRAIRPGTEEWLRLAPTILAIFERREREQRLTTEARSRGPGVVDWIYSTDGDTGQTFYFEASRRVANTYADVDADTDPPGTVRIAVAGFLRDAREGLTSLGTKSELRWEQDGLPAGPSRPDLTPLGVLPQSDRSIWVMKGQSGASVWFSLYDVAAGRTRTLLTTRMARC
jgi:hypothetical protein